MRTKANKLLISSAIFTALFGSALISATALAQESEGLILEEILVTAQKRSESLSEVPIAISVFSSESIDQTGVQELRDLTEYIPNVTITQGTDFGAQINIRGVGANARNIGFDSRVGVYLDGVYLGQGPALNQDLVDLEQIEVLRGPQGTLFGKNTVAGAINMISTKPSDQFEGNVTANVYNMDGLELKAMINIPMGDTVAARISYSDRTRDGFIKNIYEPSHVPQTFYFPHPQAGIIPLSFPLPTPFCSVLGAPPIPGFCSAVGPDEAPVTNKLYNNVDTQSYRAQLRITPNDKLDINIAVDGLESDRIMVNSEPFTDTFGSTIDHFAPKRNEVSYSETSWETREIFGANLNIDYAMDNGHSLRSITAYRNTEMVHFHDTDTSAIDFLYIDYRDEYKQTTQEFQWISPDDAAFKYVAGLYYYNQDSSSTRDAVTGNSGWLFGAPNTFGGGAYSAGEVETDSWAVFLNGSYDFDDRWTLGFGFRYSDETKDVVYHLDGTRSGAFGIGSTPPQGYIDSDTYTNFAPLLTLGYAMGDNTNIYAKFSTGFKSGGFNVDYVKQIDLASGIEFDEETVEAFELGLKSTFLDGRFQLNSAAFIANYEDYQVNQFFDLGFDEATGAQLTSIRITNAAEVDTSGLEFEATFNVTNSLTLNATLGLLDAEFADFPGGTSVDIPDPEGGEPITVPVNAKGNELPLAPSVSGSFGFQHYTTFSAVDLLVRLDVIYTGSYYTTIANEKERNLTGLAPTTLFFDLPNYGIPNTIDYGYVDSFTTLNGRIGLISNSGTWEVSIWGRNLTDEFVYVDMFRDFFGSLSGVANLPRTYGIEATWHFGAN
jgi:iron complex outermembrane receptor protein